MSVPEVLLYILIPALVGGTFSGFSAVRSGFWLTSKKGSVEESQKWDKWHIFFESELASIICAVGIVGLAVWGEKIDLGNASTNNIIFIVGLCAVASSNGNRFLRMLHDRIAQQVMKQEQDLNRTDIRVDNAYKYSSAIATSTTALERKAGYIDVPKAIEALEDIKDKFPTDRLLNIYLGRLYRKAKDYDRGIFTLRRFISETKNKEDQADAYFNIACYHVLKAQNMPSSAENRGREIERLKNEAIEALRTAVELNPENRRAAQTDEDFNSILDDERFKEVTADLE